MSGAIEAPDTGGESNDASNDTSVNLSPRRWQRSVGLVDPSVPAQGGRGSAVVTGQHDNSLHAELAKGDDHVGGLGTQLVADGDGPEKAAVVLDEHDSAALILERSDGVIELVGRHESGLAEPGRPALDGAGQPVASHGLHVGSLPPAGRFLDRILIRRVDLAAILGLPPRG